uniref:Transmembrane protein n=1 Tax=Kalanchoe fedtschenkoi TaxID=63787 RepID=A0A7N0TSJ7_KALFE
MFGCGFTSGNCSPKACLSADYVCQPQRVCHSFSSFSCLLMVRDGLSGDGSISGFDSDSACSGGVMPLPNLFKSQTACSAANKLRGSQQDRIISLVVGDAAGRSGADVEKGSPDASTEDEVLGIAECSKCLPTHVRKALQRQISEHSGGTLARHLLDCSLVLLKIAAVGKSDRWRKCRRSASFDSRKVGLFFSILSSVGTLILIYLTLRVRQAAEASVPV